MTKATTFGKAQVNELIRLLKQDNIRSTSFYYLTKNMSKYIPNHQKNNDELRTVLNTYSNLFKNAGIEIYLHNDQIVEQGREYIKQALLHFKNNLQKTIITSKELRDYLLATYGFKLHFNNSFYGKYNVNTYMQELEMSFTTSKKQREKSIDILKKFLSFEIVTEYKNKNKTFTIPKICEELEGQISIASLYNYSNEIVELGIPLKKNKMILNAEKYDEKDIINKLCTHILQKGIKQIYAGQLSKYARQLSLPIMGYKKILAQKEYILDIFGIEVLDFEKSLEEKEKLANTIKDNKKYLKEAKLPQIKYINELPLFYDDEIDIIALSNINKQLEILWHQYLEFYIINLSRDRINVKNELLDENQKLRIDTQNKKIFFLLHDELHISNLTIEDIIKLSLKDVLSENKTYGIHRQNMFIGFLLYLHSQNLLLISFNFVLQKYYNHRKAQSELLLILKENHYFKLFNDAADQNRLNTKETKQQRLFYFFLTTLNNDVKIEDINDEVFYYADSLDEKISQRLKKIFNGLGANLNILNNKLQYTQDYYRYMKNDNFKDFILICSAHIERKIKLKETKTPKEYCRDISSKIVKFLEFVDNYHKGLKLNKQNLQVIFDYPDSKLYTYQEYVDNLSIGDSTKSSRLYIFVEIFANTKGYEGICTKEKIPRYNLSSSSSRNAIEDYEIIYKINDIVTNRPPSSNYYRNHKVDIDMSWWKHLERVRPFEPLLIKLHLQIPVRGGTLRLIDRDKILQFNNQGTVKGFYFVSDKNKNRRKPFIVPNIWRSELNFLINLIEYHKQYFPNIKRFYPDDTTLKDGIVPLFANQEGTANFSNSQHLLYWTKVLIQTQMEFEAEGKNYNLVYSDEIELPKTHEELNNLTSGQIKSFKRKYDIHTLRHTGITRYINAGMPPWFVQQLSGHSGLNTLLTIYWHANEEKLINEWAEKLNINIPEEINMHQISELFIKKEILKNEIDSINPSEILTILNQYCFFNLENRTVAFKNEITLDKISKTDPKFWKPCHGGICTKQQCPDEIIGRCSLCPYFISNYLFTNEIGLNMQLSMSRVKKYSDMVIANRKFGNNKDNSKLRQLMNVEIEDFIGWLEVLSLANDSYSQYLAYENEINGNNSLILEGSNAQEKSIYSIIPAINLDHGYLEVLSQAYAKKLYDNETVVDLTNQIANKIIRYHAKNNIYHEIENMENEQIIKSFLPKFEQVSKDWHKNSESKKQLVKLLKILDNQNQQLEYKNENTFLTE